MKLSSGFLISFFCLICLIIPGLSDAQTMSGTSLKKDAVILVQALKTLHPGLYRYQDSIEMEKEFDKLTNALTQDQSLQETYLMISRFLAKINCGHTYANYWNQSAETKEQLFKQPDKVPFTFKIFSYQIVIDHNLSSDPRIQKGDVIESINGYSSRMILDSLALYLKADGSNQNTIWNNLQISGQGKYEAFDIFFPMLFPALDGIYDLVMIETKTGQKYESTVMQISRERRKQLILERYRTNELNDDDLWNFELIDDQTGHLKIGTFATYQMTLDWKAFLRSAFNEMKEKGISNLVLDIRGNEGGLDEVNLELAEYIVQERIKLPVSKNYVRNVKTPDELRPYLGTWDRSFYDWGKKVVKAKNGLYQFRRSSKDKEIEPSKKMFPGTIYILVDGANSSATFYLARSLKSQGKVTLVGQTTGGNLRGMNGGAILFLRLPHSKIEVDIPLIATFFEGAQPDAGLEPDIYIEQTIEDFLDSRDTVLEAVLDMIDEREKK